MFYKDALGFYRVQPLERFAWLLHESTARSLEKNSSSLIVADRARIALTL